MKALLLSGYAAVSHRHWTRGLLREFPDIDWTLLELPPRHFQWRVRGNPLIWLSERANLLAEPYDLVLATSMVDLATLIGLFPTLARAHKVVYFHENQFAFPRSPNQPLRPEPLMVNLYAALAADRVAFNSAYNRDSFVAGVSDFLSRMPDKPAIGPRLDRLAAQAQVLPVPLDEPPLSSARAAASRHARRIVWNHRWEYDKNPETFFAALATLSERGIDFEVAVMGQQFRQRPPVFDEAREWLGERVVCWGEQPVEAYRAMLDSASIVVSTTHHEFQGLAIMEAVQRGCLPLVPDRLCFPQFYPEACRYAGSQVALEARLAQWLSEPASRPALPDARVWQWPAWRDAYRRLLGV
ncbi:DUF3524 domain-containing protein [Halomonas sp. HP20-15]|uniref:tRNA-queuosine alpha-mannosyltransferase domain-containing protein n=1 Tax=Halomonas sp. HP20-15 TaxID=3085901 RepID=UPI0029820929|nr:DUF3524 domain-containing protein [Halomonas sp. HP20-15]MDW5377989.1 DUF3524 domain-containing protein [Halomonas sp. HP20-15]